MKIKTTQELLSIYDSLPGLLDIATKQAKISGGYVYEIQDKLREEYRAQRFPFRWSMPFRSLFSCLYCDYADTQVKHVLENPPMKNEDPTLFTAELSEEDIHVIREHGIAFSAECHRFLSQFAPPTE